METTNECVILYWIYVINLNYRTKIKGYVIISLHSPERMTVNHDVAGSSPARGATEECERLFLTLLFMLLQYPKTVGISKSYLGN